MHSYRDRLPASDRIVVETIHSGFQIVRQADMVVQYSPPSRLRRYDLILLDEASQVEDHVAQKVIVGIRELPQRPMLCVAADFAQLRPVDGGSIMRALCDRLPCIHLKTVFRTRDPELLAFLGSIRVSQPSKAMVRDFFRGRHFECSLTEAIRRSIAWMQANHGRYFAWLCVTNKGADTVNCSALAALGISQAAMDAGFPGDPKVRPCF